MTVNIQHAPPAWAQLRAELALWAAAGRSPALWLRDDDTIEDTPALRRLAALGAEAKAPVLVAVIPARAADHLADFFSAWPLLDPAVHGYSHRNHASAGEKSQEFPIARGRDAIVRDLISGRERLAALFGDRLSALYVPPWNRISAEVAALLPAAGFAGLSAFGTQRLTPLTSRLVETNTHVDIIDWKGNRGGRDPAWLAREVAVQLTAARVDGRKGIGILTHHLVHDEVAWRFLSDLMNEIARHPGVSWQRAAQMS